MGKCNDFRKIYRKYSKFKLPLDAPLPVLASVCRAFLKDCRSPITCSYSACSVPLSDSAKHVSQQSEAYTNPLFSRMNSKSPKYILLHRTRLQHQELYRI